MEKKTTTYNESRKNANRKYDAKTYKVIQLRLRVDEDEDIIADYFNATASGIKGREWIRQLFNK